VPVETPRERGAREQGADLLILLPVCNEEANLDEVLAGVRAAAPGAKVLVVDDGSSDDSVAVARRGGAAVLSHPFNLGYGAAIQTGFRWAARRGYGRVVHLDADGQHDPADIGALLAALDGADVVVGSRFLGGASYPIPWSRRLGMRLFSRAASLATGQRITDASSGYQALRGAAVRYLAEGPYPVDFPDADTLILLHRAGFRVREIPVAMRPRRAGRSMIGPGRSLYYVFKMLLSILVTLLRPAPHPAREDGE
jgi:glycosyltransferase involved in cell wall biosynthesis